ncbi:PPOX class F420-dependent oxidoreductase [Nocardia alni]|uniref:PPOX class F420-dependent oxidoreductase n=1 Tax=Nocardia alni TaxID=2815723 RepID=UPI001C22F97E|nr:PPOX class F420-dependent oxidoreductase [Nocardia alni]
MTTQLAGLVHELIDGPHHAILSTVGPDGRPQSSVIFVKDEGDTFAFSTIKGRVKTRNMTRDPRVSLVVASTSDGRYVEIRGHVQITDDPRNTLGQEMYDRYMGGASHPDEPGAERLIVRVVPDKFTTFVP